MNRWLALALAALCTALFLEGVALGTALGIGIAETGEWLGFGVDWRELAEIAVWVALLMAPAVAYLRTRRRELWRVTWGLSFGVALISYVRFRLEPAGRIESLAWAACEGIAFALGLLFFDLIAGLFVPAETAGRRGAAPRPENRRIEG